MFSKWQKAVVIKTGMRRRSIKESCSEHTNVGLSQLECFGAQIGLSAAVPRPKFEAK